MALYQGLLLPMLFTAAAAHTHAHTQDTHHTTHNSHITQGIHMESTTKEGSYRDDAVYRAIRSHNLKTRGLNGFDAPGSLPPY